MSAVRVGWMMGVARATQALLFQNAALKFRFHIFFYFLPFFRDGLGHFLVGFFLPDCNEARDV
jgi:hypothetical protein